MTETNPAWNEADPLVELLGHPAVQKHLDRGILVGLSGRTQVDYAIGVVERAVASQRLHEGRNSPTSVQLLSGYDRLRSHPGYRPYFPGHSVPRYYINPAGQQPVHR